MTPFNGSNFTTLKMMEGFLELEHIKTTNAGNMQKRLEALRKGDVEAVSLMEPWISYAQKEGLRILIESHSTRAEAAGDELDGPTLAAMFRAQAGGSRSAREERSALRPLSGCGDGRPSRGAGLPDMAPSQCAAAAVHP